MAAFDSIPLPAPHDRVTLTVTPYATEHRIAYRGAPADLIAAGVATHEDLEPHPVGKRYVNARGEPVRIIREKRATNVVYYRDPNAIDDLPGVSEWMARESARVSSLAERRLAELASRFGTQDRAEQAALRLAKRYPGVRIEVEWISRREYKGWSVRFVASSDVLRAIPQLPPALLDDDSRRHIDEFGHRWYAHSQADGTQTAGYHVPFYTLEEEEWRPNALTATMQQKVMRMLRPFVRGTWQPQS